MKFPFFNFSRKARSLEAASAASPNTGGKFNYGSAINTPVVLPEYASQLREYADFNRKQLRMFDSTVTTKLNADFVPTVGSANAEVQSSLYITRGRNRTLVKDFPTATGILRTNSNNVCGDDPFRLQMKVGSWDAEGKKFTPDVKTNRMIEEWWKDVKLPENLTVRGDMGYVELCHVVANSAFRDGSVIIREHDDYDRNKYNYALELIEADRLQENYTGRADKTGNIIRFSIERDKWNRPVAYWILNRHPGDIYEYNGWSPDRWRERVPAEEIIHFNNLRTRAEQDVGFPEEMASVAQTLHRGRQFTIAHLTAAIQSCAKPWWIKQEFPTGMNFAGDPALTFNQVGGTGGEGNVAASQTGDGKGGGANKFETFAPGTARKMDYGQSLEQLDPRYPMEGAVNLRRDTLLDVSTGVGMSYASVSGDVKEMSFSVARFSVLPERQTFKVRQEKMICDFVRRHFNGALENAVLTGRLIIPMTQLEEIKKAANFKGVRWPYVQPVQDVQADGIAMELYLQSPQEILSDSEGGRNSDDVLSEIAAWRESLVAHGIPLPEDATVPTMKKGEPGETEPPTGNQPSGPPKRFKRVKADDNAP